MSQHRRSDWAGRTVVCMASGPSLTQADVDVVRERHAAGQVKAIAVSDVYRLAPWADVVFSADLAWWKGHMRQLKAAGFGVDRLWTGDNVAAQRFQLQRIRMANRPGLGVGQLHTGGNSGYMALNLGWLFGGARFILLGYDMQLGAKGQRHFFGDHPAGMVQVQLFEEWRHRYEPLARDLRNAGAVVVNATRRTALECFPCQPLEQALGLQQETAA